MLLDLAHYLIQPAPAVLCRLGHVRDSVSLMSRSRRCRSAWTPHLAAARAAAAEAFGGLQRRRVAVVLGSGLLDDVPLHELAAAFGEVRLVDAARGAQARERASGQRRHRRVAARTRGCADRSTTGPLRGAGCRSRGLGQPALAAPDPAARLAGGAGRGGATGSRPAHRRHPSRGALGARGAGLPRHRRYGDRTGPGRHHRREPHPMHGLVLPNPDSAWGWTLAPFGEAARDRETIHRVHAYRGWGATCRPARWSAT